MNFDGNYSVKWALGLKVYCLINNSIELKIMTLLTVCSLCVMVNMSSQWPHGDELTKSTTVALIAWLNHGQQTKVEFNHREGYHYGFMDVKSLWKMDQEHQQCDCALDDIWPTYCSSGGFVNRSPADGEGIELKVYLRWTASTLSSNAGLVWGGWNETLTEVIY